MTKQKNVFALSKITDFDMAEFAFENERIIDEQTTQLHTSTIIHARAVKVEEEHVESICASIKNALDDVRAIAKVQLVNCTEAATKAQKQHEEDIAAATAENKRTVSTFTDIKTRGLLSFQPHFGIAASIVNASGEQRAKMRKMNLSLPGVPVFNMHFMMQNAINNNLRATHGIFNHDTVYRSKFISPNVFERPIIYQSYKKDCAIFVHIETTCIFNYVTGDTIETIAFGSTPSVVNVTQSGQLWVVTKTRKDKEWDILWASNCVEKRTIVMRNAENVYFRRLFGFDDFAIIYTNNGIERIDTKGNVVFSIHNIAISDVHATSQCIVVQQRPFYTIYDIGTGSFVHRQYLTENIKMIPDTHFYITKSPGEMVVVGDIYSGQVLHTLNISVYDSWSFLDVVFISPDHSIIMCHPLKGSIGALTVTKENAVSDTESSESEGNESEDDV